VTKKSDIIKSSGNIFADLDVPESETALAKADLARRINAIIRKRDMTQAEAAMILGIDQAKVSALNRGRLTGFSTERLFRLLNALGQDVQIVVRKAPASRKRGQVTVMEAMPAARSPEHY